MSLLDFLTGTEQSGDGGHDDRPCRETGHDFGEPEIYGYYTDGIPHFGFKNSWGVTKKTKTTCRKCGKVDFQKQKIGKISVDAETDELTIEQNEVSE